VTSRDPKGAVRKWPTFGYPSNSLASCLVTGTDGLLLWKDNWVTFVDSMFHMQVVASSDRAMMLPTRIGSLRIDPVGHEKFVTTDEDGNKGMVTV